MKFVSIDLETTGLNADENQIIEFGAVLEDTNNILPLDELPKFHAYITHPGGNLTGNIFALNLNAGIIEKLKNQKEYKDEYNYVKPKDLADDFLLWLHTQGFDLDTKNECYDNEYKSCTINVAGKNFNGFDRKFLDKIPTFSRKIRMRTRVIDPGVLFVDWHNDDALPSLDQCNTIIGHTVPVQHTAVEDAVDVIRLLRTRYS